MVAIELSKLRSHTQLHAGIHESIDIIFHLIVVIVVVVERTLIGTIAVLVDKDDTVGEGEFVRARTWLITFGIRVQVLSAADLGRYLAQPSTVVQLSAIDLDEVDMVKCHGVTILVNRPINLETRLLSVGQVVHIALAEERLEPVGARRIHGDGRVGEFGPAEREHSVLEPQRPIGLAMEGVVPYITIRLIRIITIPIDVFHIINEPPASMRHFDLVLVRLVVCYLKAVQRTVIVSALDFVPPVTGTGHTVTVHVHAHHDDARLATAARLVSDRGTLHGIAIDLHVVVVLVDDRMVKSEDDIASITAQAYRTPELAAERILELDMDAVPGIARIVSGHSIHKLPWSRQVIIHMSNIGRVVGVCRHRCHCHQCDK